MKHYPVIVGFTDRLNNSIGDREIADLARCCRVRRETLYTVLNGDTMPNAYVLARLCGELHVSADYLLFGKEEHNDDQRR